MSLSLTDQFLAELQAKFGITISNPNSLMMNGSVVSNSSLQAAATASGTTAASTASAAAASSGSSASSVLQSAMAIPSTISGISSIKGAMGGNQAAQALQNAQKAASNASTTVQKLTDQASQLGQSTLQDKSIISNAQSQAYNDLAQIEKQNNVISNLDSQIASLDPNAPNYAANLGTLNTQLKNASIDLNTLQSNRADAITAFSGAETKLGIDQSSLDALTGTTSVDMGDGLIPEEAMSPYVMPGGTATSISEAKALESSAIAQATPQTKSGLMSKLTAIWNNPLTKVGIAAASAFGLYESVKGLADHFSVSGLIGAGSSVAGFWTSMSSLHGLLSGNLLSGFPMLHSVFAFLTSTPGILIVMAALVALALIFGMSKNTDPSPIELPAVNMPTVWTQMPVYMMTIGAALAGAGISLGPTAPISQTITIPTVQLASVINSAGLTDANGNAVASAGLTGSVFVSQGTGSGGADQVVYVSQGSNGQSVAHVTTLKSGLKFAAPSSPANAYINFFGPNNTPNTDAAQGLQTSVALSAAANTLANSQGATAQQLSGSANKATTVTGKSNSATQ